MGLEALLISMIPTMGPKVVDFAIALIKRVKKDAPEAISPEQWNELASEFDDDYWTRRKKLAAKIGQA